MSTIADQIQVARLCMETWPKWLIPEYAMDKCSDCKFFQRCRWLIGRQPNDKPCDWTPSRFVPSTDLNR